MTTTAVHPTAIVAPDAELGAGVVVGPFALVGARVRLGDGTVVHGHAVVREDVRAGARCHVHPFAVVGGPPQDRRHPDGAPAPVVLGDDVVVREHATVHGGTLGRATRVGARALVMAGAHVGHDAALGDDVTLANGVQLAGHTALGDHVLVGGLAAIAQYLRVGESAFVAGGAMVERDVPPFVIAQGDRARVRALNVVGLRRRGVPEASVAALRAVFRALYAGGSPRAVVLARLRAEPPADPFARRLVEALAGAT